MVAKLNAIVSSEGCGCVWQNTCSATFKGKLVVNISDEALCNFLLLSIIAKSSILNVAEFLDPPFKTSPYTKISFVWKPVFFPNILKCCHLYWKSLCFSLLLFPVWWSIFDQPFRWLLPLPLNQTGLCISHVIFVVPIFYFDQSSAHQLIFS